MSYEVYIYREEKSWRFYRNLSKNKGNFSVKVALI